MRFFSSWTFGDGSGANGIATAHSYGISGTYNAATGVLTGADELIVESELAEKLKRGQEHEGGDGPRGVVAPAAAENQLAIDKLGHSDIDGKSLEFDVPVRDSTWIAASRICAPTTA